MRILGIETSCDETGISLIEANSSKYKIKTLVNLVSSQVQIHKKWGGVVPGLAKREHQKNLIPLLKEALGKVGLLKKEKNSLNTEKEKEIEGFFKKDPILLKHLRKFLKNYQKPKLDYLAVTAGPGLEPALWTGINLARALALAWSVPLIPINHLEAHIFINFLKKSPEKIKFPVLALVVSGGHTQLVLMPKLFKYKTIGETRDDAAGECFDKTGRLLGIDYPAGPVISKLAEKGDENFVKFPRPMISSKDFDFSFSGLKTAVLYYLRDKDKNFIKRHKKDLAASIQKAIVEVLASKTLRAAKKYKARTLILGGGVASNKLLQKEIEKIFKTEFSGVEILYSRPELNTDNALMVALTAFYRIKYKKVKNTPLEKVEVKADCLLDES